MMTLHEEIKKGLVEAIAVTFWAAKDGDAHDLKDACDVAHTSMTAAMIYIQHLEAERDAAINALKNGDVCEACKHFGTRMDTEPCAWCGSLYSNFEWRGVQKEG